MRRIFLFIYFIFQVLLSSVNAQSNYPVFVTPTLSPPYSLNLSDYSKFGSQKLMITIHINDLNISNLPVKLRIKLETTGVTIENPATIATTPIYIDGGTTNILFGNDLTDYFNINNLIFKGYSKETYNRTGQLPEGFYRFSVEVLHFNTNRVISNPGTATAWIALGKPPVLKLPENNAQMGQFKGMPLTFSWLSSNVGSPVSTNTIQYKFEMWEMHVPGINPNVVAASMPVFHEHTDFNKLYSLYPTNLLMKPGMQYAWRVTASDLSGFVPFEQNGHSEIRTFIYKAACDSITDLTSSHRGKNGPFSWNPEENHTSFNVEMRNPKTNWMANSESFENKAEFFDLDYGATYEMRVQAVCDGDPDSKSDFSSWNLLTIPTPAPPDTADCPDCICDDDIPAVELQNFDLRNDLQPGDTIINKTGTSRFILKTVEDQGSGVYKGIFLFWAEIWKLKFICNYWDLQVNTDDVIVNMDFESVYDPQFLVDVDATIDYLDSLAGVITTLTTDTQIDDTLTIDETINTIYVNEGDSVIIVTVDNEGNTTETVISDNVDDLEEILIEGEDGEEYIVTSDGEVMGFDEYRNTGGGNDGEIDDYNEEKEENNLSEDITVSFTPKENQKFGFDQYSEEKIGLQSKYPSFNNGYKPAYKSIASFSTDIVGASNSGNNIIFKDEMGIPALKTGEDITLRGSSNGADVALYAYQVINDTIEKIAGKLNILSFDEQAKQLYIVPVNGATTPDETSLQEVLNKAYSQAITRWQVTKLGNLSDIVFENVNMTHGGTSAISVYNNDQKTIVNTFEDRVSKLENNAYYLFFVENVTFKENSIAGYMPLQRQVGFIYDNPNDNIIAHELGHGAFNLWHTFSPDNFIATEHTTQNLMDYKGGTDLWKHQWQLVQSPDKMVFGWLQDESEGEAIQNLAYNEYFEIQKEGWGNYGYLSPIGTAILISGATHLKFNEDGCVLNFKLDGKTYYGVHSVSAQNFLGYLSEDDKAILTEHQVVTTEFESEFNQKKFTGIQYLEKEKTVVAIAKKKYQDAYLDCVQKTFWKNQEQSSTYTGIATPPFIPDFAFTIDWQGSQCSDYQKDGVKDGIGIDIYFALINEITEEQKQELVNLANYMTDMLKDKKFGFFGYGLEDFYMSGSFNSEILKYFRDNKIYNEIEFEKQFNYSITKTRDYDYIFSNKDLWAGIPDEYNRISKDYIRDGIYEYSLSDLIAREKYFTDDNIFIKAIIKFEESGDAQPIAIHENYDQYVAKYGTDAALFAWAEFAARTSEPLLKAYMAYRFLPQLISEVGIDAVINKIIKEFGEEEAKKFIKGALMEATMYYSVAELLETSIDWKDFTLDVTMAGLRNTIYVGEDMQAWAACLQGIELNTATNLLKSESSNEVFNNLLSLSAQCFIPFVFEKYLGNTTSDLYKATQRSSTTKLARFFNKLKLSNAVQADLIFLAKKIDEIAGSRGTKWVQEMKRLIPTENGSRAYDLLINASFDISKLSWRNFERLNNIISKLDDNAAKSLEDLFKGTLDVNRMLIYLEKSGSSLTEYSKAMDEILQKNLFSGSITLSGGKTMSKLDFAKNYVGDAGDLIKYYHKDVEGKQYFLKYHPTSNQGAVIVIDSYTKVIASAECKIIVNITQQELQTYKEQIINDEE